MEVTASADVAITKTGPASVVPGTNVVYTITVTNTGPSDAASVVVTDATPAGLTFVSNTGDCLTAFPCALGTVPAGATRTITATFTVPASYTTPNPIVNTASVATATTDPVPANNSATVQTAVALQADLAITKTGPASVVPGTNVVYTITVTNAGPSARRACGHGRDADGADLCVEHRRLPDGLPVRARDGAGRRAAARDHGDLRGAGDYTTPDPIVNTAMVATATTDPVPGNNTATVQTAVALQADLAITKTGPASVVAGTNVVYTITVTNTGPSDAASVVVTDAPPTGLTFVSNTGDCLTAFPCALGTVPSGATRTITATFAVPLDYTTPDPIVNTASVTTTTTDPVAANNTATVQTPLNRNADVEVTKTAPTTVLVGDTVAIGITAFNHGPGAATGVEVTDVLPAGFTFVSSAPTQGDYNPVTGVWTVGALALDGQAQLVIMATATSPGAITNVAVKTRPERARSEHEQRLGGHDHQLRSGGRRAGPQERRPQRGAGRRERHLHRARDQPRPEPRDGGGGHRCAARRPDSDHRDAIAGHVRGRRVDGRLAGRAGRGEPDARRSGRRAGRARQQRGGDGAGSRPTRIRSTTATRHR